MSNELSDSLPLLREKAQVEATPVRYAPIQRRRKWLKAPAVLAVLATIAWWHSPVQNKPSIPTKQNGKPSLTESPWLEWSNITPSEKLVWHPCYPSFPGNMQCARLTVPMDYKRPLAESSENPKVHIAIVMLPGKNRNSSPASYGKSPLLINPGGPGGSGAFFTVAGGGAVQNIVGDDYDVLGFDPRGIGATTPPTDCFADAASSSLAPGVPDRNQALLNRVSWIISGHDVGTVNSSDVALEKLNTRSIAHGQLCARAAAVDGKNSIYKYVSTPNVARDMISIIDAWDEWKATALENSEKATKEPAKLTYWGFSYGTLLGATFAAMFPDRVGRVMLDGVVNADHYVEPTWFDSLQDADAILDKFHTYCHKAKANCALYRKGDEAKDIKARFFGVLEDLKREPKIVIHPLAAYPAIINYSDVKMMLAQGLYSPIRMFPMLADFLDALYRGDDLVKFVFPPSIPSICTLDRLPTWPSDAQAAIMCSDKRYKMNETLPELEKEFKRVASFSQFADFWLAISLSCNKWSIEAENPPMRWDDRQSSKLPPVNTSFPVLFLSSRLDPVTPLQAALKMTKVFVNSSVVEQNSEGHCTLACPNLCTLNKIRDYLHKGVVPPVPKWDKDSKPGHLSGEWTVCECGAYPWKPSGDVNSYSVEESTALKAMGTLQTALQEHGLHGFGMNEATLAISPLRKVFM